MTKTGKVNTLLSHHATPFLEMNPSDAIYRVLKDGEIAIIRNNRGEVRVKVKVTNTIKEGVVFMPMHWGKILNNDFGRANNLTNNIYDPVSKEPDFKFAAVQVTSYEKPFQKICVVGAGAAAYRFVQSYRELNKVDEIHVFSKEKHPFYNRVLLPEYVSEHLQWEDLVKMERDELRQLNIHLHSQISVEKIDRELKTILASDGKTHDYDLLITATGARSFVPRDVPGGGLLGLELAAALRSVDVSITIVQRASRLMERQLDSIASKLLSEDVKDSNPVVYNVVEVQLSTSICKRVIQVYLPLVKLQNLRKNYLELRLLPNNKQIYSPSIWQET